MEPSSAIAILMLGALILSLPILFFWWITSSKAPPAPVKSDYEVEAEQREQREVKAYGCAIAEIRSQLLSPSSTKFLSNTIRTNEMKAHEFNVSGQLDAENGFGAMIRKSFRCSVTTSEYDQCESADCSMF